MCEKHDLGRQEPAGCRYVYGDPGTPDWHFCQRQLVDGARPGDANNPPYCARHKRVTLEARTPAKLKAYEKFLERIAQSDEGAMYDWRVNLWGMIPTDVYVKVNTIPLSVGHEDSWGGNNGRTKKHG